MNRLCSKCGSELKIRYQMGIDSLAARRHYVCPANEFHGTFFPQHEAGENWFEYVRRLGLEATEDKS